jgi:hypothetical protein
MAATHAMANATHTTTAMTILHGNDEEDSVAAAGSTWTESKTTAASVVAL